MRITNKMLTILLVILLVTFKITSAETSDDKFIDSLPEDQKREFLEKVEERIKNEVPEVKSPAGNDTDVDFYELQLENQGKSIQNILRTEIDRLKRRSINDTSGNRRSNRNEEDDSHIDLTMRSRKDKRRAELESIGKPIKTVLVGNKPQESEVIPVAIKYDSESIYPEKVSAEVKKTNEITWIKTSSTKSLDISNDSANTSETGRRINYIDMPLHTLDNVAPRSKDFNESADADGTTRDNLIAPIYHENSDTSSFTSTTSKEAIQSNVKLNDDISATETISTAEFNVTSQTLKNEEDETKGNVFVTTDDVSGPATQSYTVAQKNNADSTALNYSYLQTNYESSSLTLDDVTTESDVFIKSTVKYESDAYLNNELRNETEEYINSQNIGVSRTPYADISAILDGDNANKHVTNNNKPFISNNTAAYDVNAVSDENSTNKIFIDSFTVENNITLGNVSDSASIHNSASQITNNPMAGTADKRIVDLSTHTVDSSIAFKNNGVATGGKNIVNPDHGFIATTDAFSKNEQENVDHNPVLQNLLGSSLLGIPSHGDQGDIAANDNIFSVTTDNIISSTLIGKTNAFVDDTENYINALTNSPSGSTKLDDVNALSDTNDGSVTVNIISEKTTDNVVGVTKLGNVNPDTAANYLNTATDGPSGSTVLGGVSAEKYDENQRTTTDNVQVTTDNLAGSTKLGDVDIEKDIIIDFTGPMPHEASLKGEKTSYELPNHLKVVFNIVHQNQTKNKTKLNNDDETNNTALLKSVSKDTNGKDLEDFSKHLTMRMKEDQNLYRVYEVGQKKETISPTHNEKDENDTHYVRVYNYDPENAYFNADDQRNPTGKKYGEKILRENPVIIKEIEARSKSTSIDVNFSSQFNTSKPSLKIEDVKDMDTPVTNNYVDVAVDEVILGDFSELLNGRVKTVETKLSDDDTAFEKPLKRGLNKIRQMLFNADHKGDENKNTDRVRDQLTNQREVDTEYNNDHNVMKAYNEKHEGLTKDIENILTQLKNLVDHVDDTKTSVSKADSVLKTHDSVDDIYKDIINSLKTSQNPDIQLMVETLQNIEDNKENKFAKSADKPRFKIKDRDGKDLKKDLSSKQEDYIPLIIPEDIYVKANEFEESKPKPIILEDKYLELHVNTLKNLVDKDDEGLEGYDWLGTTVLIQAGIEKLQHIVDTKLHHKRLHPLDHQLLEFIIDLHLTAEEVNEDHKEDIESQRRLSFPKPKGKKGKKQHKKTKTLHKIFNDLKKGKTRKRSGHDVNDLEEFLDCLKEGLNDLHTAIKQISLVTKYKSQHWFRDIKQLYLKSAGTKEYLELLLHITTARLISLLDESAKKLVAEDEDFIKKNRASIERIGVEFIMVLKICKELEALN